MATIPLPATRVPADGRAARGLRARTAVASALLDLLTEGVLKPTAQQIAARAAVSLRLVFHHFQDLESIHAEAAELQSARLRPLFAPVAPSLPLGRRIQAFVRVRTRLHEAVGSVRRASIRLEPFSPVIAARLANARSALNAETRRTFAAELAQMKAGPRRDLRAALEALTAWETWEVMRRQQGLSEQDARRAIARGIAALLADPDHA